MKKSVNVKYGCSTRSVELPIPFSPGSFEECLRNVFGFKGREIVGLRHPNSTDIIVLEDLTSDQQLMDLSSRYVSPFIIVFHNQISNYRRKETRLSLESFISYLEYIGITESVDRLKFAVFARCFFQTLSWKRVSQLLNLTVNETSSISRDTLYTTFIKVVELPFPKRIHFLFTLFDENGDGFLTVNQLTLLLQVLYWQEMCVFAVGKLCSINLPFILLFGRNTAHQMMADYLINHNSVSFSQILFWLLNRGDSIFNEGFYRNPSPQILASFAPSVNSSDANEIVEASQTEFLYCAAGLYGTILEICTPQHSLDELLSGYINTDDTVNDDDFVHCVYLYFGIDEDSEEEVVLNIDDFCSLCKLLFHQNEDSEYVNYLQVTTFFTLLVFINSGDISYCIRMLIDQMSDVNNVHVIDKEYLTLFFQGLVRLLTVVQVSHKNGSTTINLLTSEEVKKKQTEAAQSLFTNMLSFAVPSHIENTEIRDKILHEMNESDGVHVDLVTIALAYILSFLARGEKLDQLMDDMKGVLDTPHPDQLFTTIPARKSAIDLLEVLRADLSMDLENVEDDDCPLDKNDMAILTGFMPLPFAPVDEALHATSSVIEAGITTPIAHHHVKIFSLDSSLGIFIRYMTRKWAKKFRLQNMNAATLLHTFSLFERFSGDSDNLFFSEYTSFITALLTATNSDNHDIPRSLIKLFYRLSHDCPCRVDRYELLVVLALLCCDIHVGENLSHLWELILKTSSTPAGIDSFLTFSTGVVSLVDLMLPHLLEYACKEKMALISTISATLYTSCCESDSHLLIQLHAGNMNRPIIPFATFSEWAPSSFRVDEFICNGRAIFNMRVYALQDVLGLRMTTLSDVIEALKCVDEGDGTISSETFYDMLQDFYPLPPFSVLETQRKLVFQDLVELLREDGDTMKIEVIMSAFSVILNGPREDIWNELLIALSKESIIEHNQIRLLFTALIKMTLFVQIGRFNPNLIRCIQPFLAEMMDCLPSSCHIDTVRDYLCENLRMVLPISFDTRLIERPVLLHGMVLALRIIAGLGDVLFSRFFQFVMSFDREVLSKGDYVHIIEFLTRGKSLDFQLVMDIYRRIYNTAQRLFKNPLGIHRNTLLTLMSAFYPNNSTMASLLYEQMSNGTGLGYDTFVEYLGNVYSILNEFFDCFDISVVTMNQIARNVAESCFHAYKLAQTDLLSKDEFVSWIRSRGVCDFTDNKEMVSYYPCCVTKSVLVTYELLQTNMPTGVIMPRHIYETGNQCHSDLQILIDRLASFASLMNFSVCDNEIIEIIHWQEDPNGAVTRSSFIASVSAVIIKHYQQRVNEDRELQLQESIHIDTNGKDAENVRKGLGRLFDALDVLGSKRLPATELIAMLGLLSQGDIDSRLQYMIETTGKAVGDMVYVSSLSSVIDGLFLVLDMLLPTIIYAACSTPLIQSHDFVERLKSSAEMDLLEINTVVEQLHIELVGMSEVVRHITAVEKPDRRSLQQAMQTLHIHCSSIKEFIEMLLLQSGDASSSICQLNIQENGWAQGLLHRHLSPLLLRDEMRRLFHLMEVNLPYKLQERLEEVFQTLLGDSEGVLYEDFVIALFPFLVFPNDSIETVSTAFYSLLCVLNDDAHVIQLSTLEHAIQIVVKIWLWVVEKTALLQKDQVSVLIRELIDVTEVEGSYPVREAAYLGSCILQARSPSSLSMQRLLSILFCGCPQNVKSLWEGEMPVASEQES